MVEARGKVFDTVAFAIASVAFVVTTLLPVGAVRLLDDTSYYSLFDLFGSGYVILAVAVILTIVGLVQMLRGNGDSSVAAWGFGLLSGLTVLTTVLIESVGRIIPRSILPPTLRRFSFNLGATSVPWIAVLLGALAAVAALGRSDELLGRLGRQANDSVMSFRLRIIAVVGSVVGVVLLATGRNLDIASVSYAGGEIKVEPWALPWIGPGSLVAVIVLVVAVVCVAFGVRPFGMAVVGAVFAWTSAAITALMVATSGLLVDSGAAEFVASQLNDIEIDAVGTVEVASSFGPITAYLGSCILGLSFALAIGSGVGRK